MNIDERLEKLTERHEALTQYMELMSHEWNDRFSKIAERLDQLTRVAEIHERRLDDLEGDS